MYDLITIGNATVDAFLSIHSAETVCSINKAECKLCVPYGKKVLLDNCQFELGGNASNVAVGTSRLGLSTAIFAEIGTDLLSDKVLQGLGEEHIDTTHLIRKPGNTTFAVGLEFSGERTLFIKHYKREHKFSFDQIQTKWMYVTSLGNEWRSAYTNAITYSKSNNVKIACNPGTVQLDEGIDYIKDFLNHVAILIVNREEAAKIAGREALLDQGNGREVNKEIVKELAHILHSFGPDLVVITNGNEGSYVSSKSEVLYFAGILDDVVVERTGAGDAFSTGFLSQYISSADIPLSIKAGTINAGAVVGKIGAQAGLLTKEELESQLHTRRLEIEEV